MISITQALQELKLLAASEPVATLAKVFHENNQELALVGGPVRDVFLGLAPKDLDFTTSASPDEIIRIIKPIARAVWDIGRDFGTIGAEINSHKVEITTYRSDAYQSDSRKPEVVFGKRLEDDLLRRDFTVNALAIRLPELSLVDSGTGVEDLLAGILRTPIDPKISFSDDPLRMLRAARFASQLGFELDQSAKGAITELAERLSVISAERIRDEFSKLLLTEQPRAGIELLVETGLVQQFLPELSNLILESDEHHHHKDVYQHSLTVLEQAIELETKRGKLDSPDLILRIAALLHDIGKPATKKLEPGGIVTFYHHDLVGAKLARKRLTALRFDKQQISSITRLIELHLRFFGYSEGAWTDSAVRRYVRDAGLELERLHILTRADVTTRNRRKAERLAAAYDDIETRIAELAEAESLAAIRPDLDGEEIMKLLGLDPGPEVGLAYNWLLELRLDEGELGKDKAAELLKNWWNQRQNEL